MATLSTLSNLDILDSHSMDSTNAKPAFDPKDTDSKTNKFKAISFDLVDLGISANKPLPSPPSSILSLDRLLSPSTPTPSFNKNLTSSRSSSSEEGLVSPISAEIVDMPQVKGKMSKRFLTLINGLRTTRSTTALWPNTSPKPCTPLADLSPLIRQFPTPPTPNENGGSNFWPNVLQSGLGDDFITDGLYFNQSGSLCAASLTGLVRVLTSMDDIDPACTNVFFHSFRFFTTSKELFDVLLSRYNETTPPGLMVANFFLLWLRNHWRYEWDGDILEPLCEFALDRPAGDAASGIWRKVLRKIKKASVGATYRGNRMERKLYNAKDVQELDAPPTPFEPLSKNAFVLETFGEIDILYFHNPAGRTEFARQLCLAGSQLFRHFDPEDTVRYWKDGLNKSVGEKIFLFMSFENALTHWTADSVVTAKSRAEAMEFFIEVAHVVLLHLLDPSVG